MITAAHIALIPDLLQLSQICSLLCGEQLAGLPQHRFSYLFTKTDGPHLIYLQGFKQKILFGVHDADEVLQALPVMVGGVYMDMDATGVIDLGADLL